MQLRVIPLQEYGAREAAALTESLILTSTNQPTIAYFKWQKGLTVPYTQAICDVNLEQCSQLGFEVARITGGGRAYVHGEDISLAIMLPRPNRPDITKELQWLCERVKEALNDLGIPALLKHRTYTIAGQEQKDGYDIEINGKKVAGYAGTWKNKKLLIHGAFIYSRPNISEWLSLMNVPQEMQHRNLAAELETYITHLSQYKITPEKLTNAITKRISQENFESNWTLEERDSARDLITQLYETNKWLEEGKRTRGLCLLPWGIDPPGSLLGELSEK